MRIENRELIKVTGGAISATLITAIVRAVTTVIDFGKMVGSSIRRGVTKDYC